MLSQQSFDCLVADGYTHIPMVCEVLADLETPLSTYLKLADQPYSYLLESVQGGEKWGRYSIIGLSCGKRLEIRGQELRVFENNELTDKRVTADPLDEIRRFAEGYRVPELPELPRFNGGLVGYFGYDTVSYIEPHLGKNPLRDPIDAPDILLVVSEDVIVFDNLSGRLYVIILVDSSIENGWKTGQERLAGIVAQLNRGLPDRSGTLVPSVTNESDFDSSFSREDYEAAVEEVQAVHI